MPSGTVFSLWDDPDSIRISDELRTSSGSSTITMYGPATAKSIVLEVTTAGVAGVAVVRLSLDGGDSWAYTGVPLEATTVIGDYTFVLTQPDFSYPLAKTWCSTIGAWFDKSGNGYHHTVSSAANPPEMRLGPTGLICPARTLIATNCNINNPDIRPLFTTLNQPMSFFCVTKMGNINAPIYALGTTSTNCPLIVRAATTSRITVAKSNVVGSSSVSAQTPASSRPSDWYFFGFTYGGGANLTYYDGMLNAGATAAWQSTSGVFSTSSLTSDGVFFDLPASTGTPQYIAAITMMNSEATAGDVTAVKDSVAARWGGLVA
jgi:hypothetical protein